MGKNNFCKNCIHWEGGIIIRANSVFGICDHQLVPGLIIIDTDKSMHEDKALYTEEYFGCVHCEEGNRALININKNLGL